MLRTKPIRVRLIFSFQQVDRVIKKPDDLVEIFGTDSEEEEPAPKKKKRKTKPKKKKREPSPVLESSQEEQEAEVISGSEFSSENAE